MSTRGRKGGGVAPFASFDAEPHSSLPPSDRGYVEEGADVMGAITNFFKPPASATKASNFEVDDEDPTAVSYGRKVNTSEEELEELISDLTFGIFGKKKSK